MSTRLTRADRRGFGTTATLVLVILGIAMFILVVQDLMRSGTSISIGRTYATAHLMRVGRMALDEAFTSKKGTETLAKTLIGRLVEGANQVLPAGEDRLKDGNPAEKDASIRAFLGAVYHRSSTPSGQKIADLFGALPDDKRRVGMLLLPGTALETPVPGAYWARGGNAGGNGNVEFDADQAYVSKFRPETVDLAYKQDLDSGVLKVEDVEMRVVAFRHNLARGQPVGPGAEYGVGLVRARVIVHWILPKEVEGRAIAIHRQLIEDRVFKLTAPQSPPPNQPQTDEWQFEVYTKEWQKGASES